MLYGILLPIGTSVYPKRQMRTVIKNPIFDGLTAFWQRYGGQAGASTESTGFNMLYTPEYDFLEIYTAFKSLCLDVDHIDWNIQRMQASAIQEGTAPDVAQSSAEVNRVNRCVICKNSSANSEDGMVLGQRWDFYVRFRR